MQIALKQQSNIISLAVVERSTGNAITVGTVNFYLKALTGDEYGNWWRGSDSTWVNSEQIAGAATHSSDGHWELSLAAVVWVSEASFLAYAKETGDLHIAIEDEIKVLVG